MRKLVKACGLARVRLQSKPGRWTSISALNFPLYSLQKVKRSIRNRKRKVKPIGRGGKVNKPLLNFVMQELVFNGDRVSVRDDGKFLELVAVMTAEKCECAS